MLLKRRWLRYSVRTLLVAVTIFCVWLGWQMSVVSERKILRRLHAKKIVITKEFDHWFTGRTVPPVNPIRRVMGDRSASMIYVPDDLPMDARIRLHKAFPEAEWMTLEETYRRRNDRDADPAELTRRFFGPQPAKRVPE